MVVCKCARVNCAECVPFIGELTADDLAKLEYVCPSCTGQRVLFQVGCVLSSIIRWLNFVFKGFFDPQGNPVHPEGISISSTAQRTHNARVDTSSLVIVELRLSAIPALGTLARVLQAAVEGYFLPTPEKFAAYHETFNVTEFAEDHLKRMEDLVKELRR